MAKTFKVTSEEMEDGTIGICRSCGHMQGGTEPDADDYICGKCGLPEVFGLENALLRGIVEVADDDDLED